MACIPVWLSSIHSLRLRGHRINASAEALSPLVVGLLKQVGDTAPAQDDRGPMVFGCARVRLAGVHHLMR